MAKHLYSISLLTGLLLVCCADRDHNNPLDPQNPLTKGRVTGFSTLGLEKQVSLSWNELALSDLTGYNIYRRCCDSTGFMQIMQTRFSSCIDTDVVDGMGYDYYVTAQAGMFESPACELKHCIPGPTFTWIADQQSGYLYCLSHDLQTPICRFGLLSYPRIIAVSARENAAYVALRYGDQIFKVNRSGQMIADLHGLDNVVDMEVEQSQSYLWIVQHDPGRLRLIDASARIIFSISTLDDPVAVSTDNLTHTCWLVDRGSREVMNYSGLGVRLCGSGSYLVAPKDLAISPVLQKIWIADSTRIIEYDYNCTPTGRSLGGLFDAALIAFNNVEQSVWFVDWERSGKPARLFKMGYDFQILFSSTEFGYPYDIAINEFDGSCMIADISWDHYGLYRISSDGVKIDRIGDYPAPFAVAVENGNTELSP